MKKKSKDSSELSWTMFVGKDVRKTLFFTIAAVAVCVAIILLAMFSAPGGVNTYRPCGRIVITSDSKNANGFVTSTFERCRYFLIYDLATKRFKAVANPYFNEVSPGAEAARFIANRAEEAVITGNIGPVAYQTLENFNIQVYLVHKTSVRDAVRLFMAGGLVHVKPANQFGLMNAPARRTQEPPELPEAQRVAWNPGLAQGAPTYQRMAYCPIDGLTIPLGAHIRINRIMCPHHPGQIMQIIDFAGNQAGQAPYQIGTGQGQLQRVAFGPGSGYGGGPVSRGVVIMR